MIILDPDPPEEADDTEVSFGLSSSPKTINRFLPNVDRFSVVLTLRELESVGRVREVVVEDEAVRAIERVEIEDGRREEVDCERV